MNKAITELRELEARTAMILEELEVNTTEEGITKLRALLGQEEHDSVPTQE